ncbi:uncharacterized protein N7483_000579 [Penicillium malachiteum]|uniref:uncharacterized protein n=1 Tax=Penicillium malachiteum TaxID=1324776 RepID=UPI002549588C|nr:uncharacterized protein N7483_000579 [Penicillium malachiteum]KAJ5735454.1 hypothetical protein N7483_000579 [Penicillium malachiteum]
MPSYPEDLLVCLDSGARNHMSSQKELFTNTTPYRKKIWGLGGGSAISEFKGTMTFTVQSAGGFQTLEFHDTLYFSPDVEPEEVIPNLISVSRLFKQYPNARLLFTTEGCSVEMNQGQGQVIYIPVKGGDYNFVMVKEIPAPEQGHHHHEDKGDRKKCKECKEYKDRKKCKKCKKSQEVQEMQEVQGVQHLKDVKDKSR